MCPTNERRGNQLPAGRDMWNRTTVVIFMRDVHNHSAISRMLVLRDGIDPSSHDYQSCALPLSYRSSGTIAMSLLGFEPR